MNAGLRGKAAFRATRGRTVGALHRSVKLAPNVHLVRHMLKTYKIRNLIGGECATVEARSIEGARAAVAWLNRSRGGVASGSLWAVES